LLLLQIQNLESENYTLNDNIATATAKLEEAELKHKDFDEQVNTLNHKMQTLEKAEEEYQVIKILHMGGG